MGNISIATAVLIVDALPAICRIITCCCCRRMGLVISVVGERKIHSDMAKNCRKG